MIQHPTVNGKKGFSLIVDEFTKLVNVRIITRKNEMQDHIKEFLINRDFDIHQSTGANRVIIGVIGDTETLDTAELEKMPGVLQVIRINKEE